MTGTLHSGRYEISKTSSKKKLLIFGSLGNFRELKKTENSVKVVRMNEVDQ